MPTELVKHMKGGDFQAFQKYMMHHMTPNSSRVDKDDPESVKRHLLGVLDFVESTPNVTQDRPTRRHIVFPYHVMDNNTRDLLESPSIEDLYRTMIDIDGQINRGELVELKKLSWRYNFAFIIRFANI